MAKLVTDPEQRGFKHVEGGPINLGIVKLVAARAQEEGRGISYAFLDVAKAFDSVIHRRILETLAKRCVPRSFLRVVASLYQANTTTMSDGKLIQIKRSVVQGDPLSPTLFNLVLDEAVRNALSPFNKVSLGETGSATSYAAYADDLVVFASCPQELQSKLDALTTQLESFGLKLKPEKCKAIHLMKHGTAGKV